MYQVSCFYTFVKINNLSILRKYFLEIGSQYDIRGTLIIANEGINASIAGLAENVSKMIELVLLKIPSDHYNIKHDKASFIPFKKYKVKIKNEIISMRCDSISCDDITVGKYIDPKHWDKFLERDDVVVIDTRNAYEIKEGTFINAINPMINSFHEFPLWFVKNKARFENKKLAMYCTGGIRCEKATSYGKDLGYDTYHLKGGILQYFKDTNNPSLKWQGNCFVFDDRASVKY